MTDSNIKMVRGDTLAFGVEFEGLNKDLETAFFTCRKSYEGDIVFQKSLTDGISKVSGGQYRVRIAPNDTKSINAGRYYYDFQIGVNSDIFTLLKGVLDIEHDVTY